MDVFGVPLMSYVSWNNGFPRFFACRKHNLEINVPLVFFFWQEKDKPWNPSKIPIFQMLGLWISSLQLRMLGCVDDSVDAHLPIALRVRVDVEIFVGLKV